MMHQTTSDDIVTLDLPVQSTNETETNMNTDTSEDEYPKIDLNTEWKDRGFAIVFWIHTIIVILVGSILGIPAMLSYVKNNRIFKLSPLPFDFTIDTAIFGCVSAIVGVVLPFLFIFCLLQLCAGQLIKCSFIIIISIQLIPAIALLFEEWIVSLLPFGFLLITLIYLTCVRKLIAFAEVHLQTGCAPLRSYTSLKLTAIVMFIVEIVWFIFWLLMVIGIHHYLLNTKFESNMNLNSTTLNATGICMYIVVFFLLLLSWCWGAVTFGNIAHFLTVCTVGRWWFPDECSQQYSIRHSIKRAFTTSFGTLCYGSLFKALIKPKHVPTTQDSRRKNIFSCIFRTCKRAISYLNEWTFIYSTLTGQDFPEASRSFTELFQKRGWTVIINDNLIETSFLITNIGIGIASVALTILVMHSLAKISMLGLIVCCVSFLISLLMSAVFTRILLTSVRTVFVCFALNPKALGVTHPDYLQKLTKAWHKFYPKEFTDSGYANKFLETTA